MTKLDEPAEKVDKVRNPYVNATIDLAAEVFPWIPLIAILGFGGSRSEQQNPTTHIATRAIRTLSPEELKADLQTIEGTYVRTSGYPSDRVVLGACNPVLYRIPVGFEDVQYALRAADSTLLGTFRRQEYRSTAGKVVSLKSDTEITC